MTTIGNSAAQFASLSETFPLTTAGFVPSAAAGFTEEMRFLSRNLSNITTNFTDTHSSHSTETEGIFPRWLKILIAALSAGAVVIIVSFVLIWKFCGKRPKQKSQAANSGAKAKKNVSSGRCGGLCRKKKAITKAGTGTNATLQTDVVQKRPQPQGGNQRDNSGQQRYQESLAPPPIGGTTDFPSDQNAALQGVAVLPRRLAPIKLQGTTTGTTTVISSTGVRTPRRTGKVYAQLQQYQQLAPLKGVPVIPVPLDQRRSLPKPPAPADNDCG